MDLKVYGGWPIRLKQLAVNLRMENRGTTEIEALDLKQAGIAFDTVLREAQHMKEQLRAHEELKHLINDFGTVVGEGAQYAPANDAIEHVEMYREDKSVWPHDSTTWPEGMASDYPNPRDPLTWLGVSREEIPGPVPNHEFSHTSFMKLVERVGILEEHLARLRDKDPGLGY